jgi:hypothetical protein
MMTERIKQIYIYDQPMERHRKQGINHQTRHHIDHRQKKSNLIWQLCIMKKTYHLPDIKILFEIMTVMII